MLSFRLRPLPRRLTTHPSSSSSSSTPCLSTPSISFSISSEVEDEDDNTNNENPEDLFSSFLPHLFPDDAPQFHGDPGQHLLYSSPRYGDLTIMVPSYPGQREDQSEVIAGGVNNVEEGRKLFAHFLWSAAMVVAEGVENAADFGDGKSNWNGNGDGGMWRVQGERVLELGAGAGLPSIISALAHASSITITDHPSSPALGTSGAISTNVRHNLHELNSIGKCTIDIRPHEWGTLTTDTWAASTKGTYTRIIAADCYWMPLEHENLVRTMKWFLAPEGKVWVVAGFHTGRGILAGFFETAGRMGLEVERIYERDLMSSGECRRAWVSEREGEGLENRKRWCVIALLRHA
ncbi:hypothetical protein BDW59DRAFT_165076 [Aspergillus cavernicola]|uniref:Nicotinamide N-methyltransferase n=1 Tax=Aspergillus cavernicola TaxID=176166 RepID=A0ABR4HX97_9EURO